MITCINEFFFSNHYLYDNDNRFNKRIKNAKILNNLSDPIKADKRLKKALYYYGLEVLDKTSIAINPIAITFGNIYFRDGGKLQPAELEVDNTVKGNVYSILIKNQTVVTITLLPLSISNQDIADKIKAHDGTVIQQLRDIDLKELSLNDKRRKTTIIDLDITDDEFATQFPLIHMKNNELTTASGLTTLEIEEIKNGPKKKEKPRYSLQSIPGEFKQYVPDKEFVIYDGMSILVPYPGQEPKMKKIRRLVVDETGDKRKFMLEFENTLKPMELKQAIPFIISPKMSNDVYNNLLNAFDLEEGTVLNFQGPIVKFNFYSKKKTGNIPKLGIIIEPRSFF